MKWWEIKTHLEAVIIIDTITGWLEIAQYEDKIAIWIANLVETACLYIYPKPSEITYDQGKEFIGHKFKKSLIEMKYGINAKPSTPVNPMSNALLKRVHQFLGNIVRNFNISTQTYVDKNDPWAGILAAAAFEIFSTNNGKKGYSPSKLIFACGIIIPIKHRVDW